MDLTAFAGERFDPAAFAAALQPLLPELLLAAGMIVLLLTLFVRPLPPALHFGMAALFVLAALALLAAGFPAGAGEAWGGWLRLGQAAAWMRGLALASGALVLLWLAMSRPEEGREPALLILAALLGACLMILANHLLLIFLAMETLSISAYLLTAWRRESPRSSEASVKYLLLGALSGGMTLYGISWLYGWVGSLRLDPALWQARLAELPPAALLPALLLLLAGFLFKWSAAPLHFWAPDVYEGVSFPLAGLFSTLPKIAGAWLWFRIYELLLPAAQRIHFDLLLAGIAILTMTWGNLAALQQSRLRRLMAYSGVSQAGFFLMAILAGGKSGQGALLFFFTIYAFANLGAWLALEQFSRLSGGEEGGRLDGLGRQQPLLLVLLTLFLVSLGGLPPTAGFVAKWSLFLAVLSAPSAAMIALALAAAINTLISFYYYLLLPGRMLFRTGPPAEELRVAPGLLALALLAALPVLLLGLWGFGRLLEFFSGLV